MLKSRLGGMCDIPAALGPYRFERLLGSGGMGEVYLAHDERLHRCVAVKRLRRDLDHAEVRPRLRREARTLARLHHPSIVQCFDLVDFEGDEWLVMEFVDGPRIADLLGTGPLGLRRTLAYGRQVAEGLAEAHAHGLVHRDLKAENILVDRATNRAKILDFGLVREFLTDFSSASLTHTGTMVGTVRAVAPEQARGLAVGPRADLFSLGVLLYEMLSGRSPFRAGSDAETLSRLLSRPPDPLPSEVPEELTRLVAQLLEKLPELRPPGAAVVARQLARLDHDFTEGETGVFAAGGDDESTTQGFAETSRAAVAPAGDGAALAGDEATPAVASPRTAARVARWAGGGAIAALALYWLAGSSPLAVSPPGQSPPAETPPAETLPGYMLRPSSADGAPIHREAAAEEETGWEALERYDLPGRIDHAIEIFQRQIELEPASAEAHSGLARAYWRKFLQDSGDPMWLDQASAVARQAVELAGDGETDLAAAHAGLGLILNQAGDAEAARDELQAALELDPESADAHRGLAEIHQAAGRHAAAEAAYERALEIRPGDRELHDLLGTLHFRRGRWPAAEAAYRRSIELAPDSVHGYRNLAGVHIARGELEDAAALLERALMIRPTATLYLNLGTVHYYRGLYPHAAAAYERALEFAFGANYHVTWANLGDAYRQIPHRRHEASAAFRRAVRLLEDRLAGPAEEAENDAWQLSRLALYRAKAGLGDAARQILDRLEVQEPRVLLRVAVAWEVLGERRRALASLAAALDAGLAIAEVERDPELLELRSDPRFHVMAPDLPREDGS